VDMHATDLVGINGITRVLLVYTCQQGVYPRCHVLPLRLPYSISAGIRLRKKEFAVRYTGTYWPISSTDYGL
jgi:hypothetical protein